MLVRVRFGDRGEDALAWMPAREAEHALDQPNGADATGGEGGVGPQLGDGAVAGMFKRIGYHKKQTMHGFRHLISTALNDKGYEADWVERQLAHGDPDKIRGIYNKAAYLEPRRKMMQEWADYLDLIKRKADVIPIRREVG